MQYNVARDPQKTECVGDIDNVIIRPNLYYMKYYGSLYISTLQATVHKLDSVISPDN